MSKIMRGGGIGRYGGFIVLFWVWAGCERNHEGAPQDEPQATPESAASAPSDGRGENARAERSPIDSVSGVAGPKASPGGEIGDAPKAGLTLVVGCSDGTQNSAPPKVGPTPSSIGNDQPDPVAIQTGAKERPQDGAAWTRLGLLPEAYDIVEIGTLDGASKPTAVNARGWIVGYSIDRRGTKRAYMWQDGKLRDLGVAPGRESLALGINAAGVVVGGLVDTQGNLRAFALDPGDEPRLLPGLGGPNALANCINAKGVIGGTAMDRSGKLHPVVWKNGSVRKLPGPAAGQQEVAGIDDDGLVVGWRDDPASSFGMSSFFIRDGEPIELGSLAGRTLIVRRISPAGVLVLGGMGAKSINSAFVLDEDELTELDPLAGTDTTYAVDVNDEGIAVGYGAGLFGAEPRAFVWCRGETRSLASFLPSGSGWSLERATAINATGWIVGEGRRSGRPRAFLMRPRDLPADAPDSAPSTTESAAAYTEPEHQAVGSDTFEGPAGSLAGRASSDEPFYELAGHVFRLPAGWEVTNDGALVAKSPEEKPERRTVFVITEQKSRYSMTVAKALGHELGARMMRQRGWYLRTRDLSRTAQGYPLGRFDYRSGTKTYVYRSYMLVNHASRAFFAIEVVTRKPFSAWGEIDAQIRTLLDSIAPIPPEPVEPIHP